MRTPVKVFKILAIVSVFWHCIEGFAAVEMSHFLISNEHNPAGIVPLLRKIPKGALVSVGTERGFITASLNPDLEFLLLADYDMSVVRYNKINVGLLQMAHDHQDYLNLRFSATREEWQRRANTELPSDDIQKGLSVV